MITSLVIVSVGFGCRGDQRSGAVPADTTSAVSDTAAASADTAKVSVDTSTARADTSRAAPNRADTARPDTTPNVASAPAPRPPAAKPSSPKRTPAARPQADTTQPSVSAPPTQAAKPETTAAAPPQTNDTAAPGQTQTSQANAPLRDPYHTAPLDTVPQQVYNGWKQFNLNCARCHGEDVQGTTIAPHLLVSLRPDGPINTKELFVQTVCAGRPAKGMPSWCALGMEMPTIEAIYAYVKGRSDAKLHPGRPALRQGG